MPTKEEILAEINRATTVEEVDAACAKANTEELRRACTPRAEQRRKELENA